MYTAAQIEAFHKWVIDELHVRTGLRLTINPQIDRWKKLSQKGAKVFFSADGPGSQRSLPFRGNAPLPTFPLLSVSSSEEQLWWGWREEWRSENVGEFGLVGVQFIFFWGNAVNREQVFRADWDEVDIRSSDAGQPHWHVDDRFLVVQSWARFKTGYDQIEVDMAEPQPVADYEDIGPKGQSQETILNLGGAHLFMGGWKNHRESPKCWQVKLDLKEIAHWAGRTLQYVRQEAAAGRISVET